MYNELEKNLEKDKNMLDNAFETTKSKHGEEFAKKGLINYFVYSKISGISRDNNARENMTFLTKNNPYILSQILLDFAISSFMINSMKPDITEKEVLAYFNDKDELLKYDNETVTKVAALACTLYPDQSLLLINNNYSMYKSLVETFINERYINNKKNELDNSLRTKFIYLKNSNRPMPISKDRLNYATKRMTQNALMYNFQDLKDNKKYFYKKS